MWDVLDTILIIGAELQMAFFEGVAHHPTPTWGLALS